MVFGIWKEGMVDNCFARYGTRDESLVRMDMESGKEETNINDWRWTTREMVSLPLIRIKVTAPTAPHSASTSTLG